MEKRIWNQLKKAVMITAAVGILGAGAVSAAEFEAAASVAGALTDKRPDIGHKTASYMFLLWA